MKRILYDDGKGGVVQVIPCISKSDPPGFTEDDALVRALAKDVPPGAQTHIVDEADLPAREDRDGWEIKGGRVSVKKGWKRSARPQRSREEAVIAALLRKGAISEADIDAELASDRAPSDRPAAGHQPPLGCSAAGRSA